MLLLSLTFVPLFCGSAKLSTGDILPEDVGTLDFEGMEPVEYEEADLGLIAVAAE